MKMTLAAFLGAITLSFAADIAPEEPLDYAPYAFFPERWKENDISTEMIPWFGKNIVFLTNTAELDHKVMGEFIGNLDAGWDIYMQFTGKAPTTHRSIAERSPLAALPTGTDLTCGLGCGYVGAQGVEVNGFYEETYPRLKKNTKEIPHLYFYELGRNFFTFGRKHDNFTTGFAVFMRYVCVEKLEIVDKGKHEKKVILEAIDKYQKGDMPFLKAFTISHGLTEKENRLEVGPSDQPVMYASAMLKLWHHFGDDWLTDFFKHVHSAPDAEGDDQERAREQALVWYLASSLAAKKNLDDIFVKHWRLILSEKEAEALAKVDWDNKNTSVVRILKSLKRK